MTTTTRRVVLAAALFASACDGEGDEALVAPAGFDKPPSPHKGVTEPEPEPEQILLENGFVPDPHVVEGTTVGTRDASELAEGCTGFIATEPDHLLGARGAFAELRILAHADEDVSLVVERPDGTYLCADDHDDDDGTDPVLAASFGQGAYRIWVGAAQENREISYRLGFSELADVTPVSLAP